MLHVPVETWIGNAAAVLSGAWGAVTRQAHQSGYSRTAVYAHAQRVVQAVASEQAGGINYDALWHENERLKAENAALWQAWADAEELSEAKQRAFGLSDSNRTILDAKELHLIPQWVERCLGKRRLIRHCVSGLERRRLPGANLSDCRRDKHCLINPLWTKIPEIRQKRMLGSMPFRVS